MKRGFTSETVVLLLFSTAVFFFGCIDSRTGGPGSLPPTETLDDSYQALLPVVVYAAFPKANKEFGADSSWFFSFKEKGHQSYCIMNEKSSELAEGNPQLIPRPFTTTRQDGKIVHKESGASVLMLKIGTLEDVDPSAVRRLRYRIDFSSGAKEVSYYVYLMPEFYPTEKFVADKVVPVKDTPAVLQGE